MNHAEKLNNRPLNISQFQQLKLSTNPSVMAVTDFVKRENDKYRFAGKLIDKIGLPYWNKALVFTQKASAGRLSSSDETIVYVPFVQDSQQHVNTSLIVKLGVADTSFRILCDWQYAEHGFGPATDSTWNARDVFNIFATLNKEVFNSTTYKIHDDRLFGNPGNDRITVVKIRTPDLSNARWESITICNMIDVCYGPDWYNSWCNGGCTTDCEYYTHSEMECSVMWVQIPDGDTGGGGSGGGGGNGDNGGGGGGGGCTGDCGGWNPPDPCANGQPCDPPGWETIQDALPAFVTEIDFSAVNDPCLQSLIQMIGQPGHQSAILKAYDQQQYTPATQHRYKVSYKDVNGLIGSNGQQVPARVSDFSISSDGTNQVEITINRDFLQTTSKEWVASVIIHELLHGILLVNRPDLNTEELQHNAMFIGGFPIAIRASLKELFPNLSDYDALALGLGGLMDAYMIPDPNNPGGPMIIDPVKDLFAQNNYFMTIQVAEQIGYNYSQGGQFGTPFC